MSQIVTPAVYCDYNATSPLRPAARGALMSALAIGANPSSAHRPGQVARGVVEEARSVVAGSLGASEDEIVFTSGGTESIATALWGARAVDPALQVWASATEHEAVLAQGVTRRLAVDGQGRLSPAVVREATIEYRGIRPLVCVMLANNVTGAIQPVAEIAAIVHDAGGLVHCDAVQAFGKIPVSVGELDVDYLSVSAHKLGGPHGIGALYIRSGVPFHPRQSGGGQESGRRSGTENIAGIAGFAAAVEVALRGLDDVSAMAEYRDRFEDRLRAAVPGVVVYSSGAERLGNTSCFGIRGFSAHSQVMAMDMLGIALSAGSACSSGRSLPSPVLEAMGVCREDASCAVRVSCGWASRIRDWHTISDGWIEAVRRARSVEKQVADSGSKLAS